MTVIARCSEDGDHPRGSLLFSHGEGCHPNPSPRAQHGQLETLLTDRMADVREMDRKYLSRGLFRLLSVLEEAGKAKFNETQDGVIVATVRCAPCMPRTGTRPHER